MTKLLQTLRTWPIGQTVGVKISMWKVQGVPQVRQVSEIKLDLLPYKFKVDDVFVEKMTKLVATNICVNFAHQ